MTRTLARQITWSILGLTLFSSLAVIGPSQTQTPAAADLRGVIRLRVRIGSGEGAKAKGLARKRFFLIRARSRKTRV
jgi:hypothetical protein